MLNSVERLLIWFVPVSILAFALGSVAFAFHGQLSPELAVNVKLAQSLLFAAGNFVAAFWLWFRPHTSFSRRVLWFLFGATTGLWAIAIWLLVHLSERQDSVGS